MATVELAFTPAPQYVRTARLVGVAVAQRAGVPEERLDEVRLAIGEACGRAVARHRQHGVTELVRVEMSDDGPYTVRVIDAAGGKAVPADADPGRASIDEAQEADRMGEALLAAIVDDLSVRSQAAGSEVRMTWPVRRRLSGSR